MLISCGKVLTRGGSCGIGGSMGEKLCGGCNRINGGWEKFCWFCGRPVHDAKEKEGDEEGREGG